MDVIFRNAFKTHENSKSEVKLRGGHGNLLSSMPFRVL